MKVCILSFATVFFASATFADIRLPVLFGNNMVLQRDQPIPVWGWADKGEKITVKFRNQLKTTTTGKDGKWRLELDAEKAGGPYSLTVKGKNMITLSDILMGDVWVCSGQSNMEFAVSSSQNATSEIRDAKYNEIRHLEVPKAMAYHPKSDLDRSVSWKIADGEDVARFSAVGYFYARELYKELHVPIGLVHSSWGGTDIETWISQTSLEKSDLFKDGTVATKKDADLQLLIKQRKEQVIKRIKELQGGFPGIGSTTTWKELSFNDGEWHQAKLPGLWEQSIENFDGVVWFRKTIVLSADDAGKPAILELARIDDSDVTYVNGIEVGQMHDKYNERRVYPISAVVLKEGKNVIAVRIEDNGGGGGVYGTSDELKITISDKMYPLSGEWKYQVEEVYENSGTNTGTVGNPNDFPTLLFNAMINPLTDFAIKGVIWYQGENNANRAFQYRTTFPLLINDWRHHWHQGDFPFYFVQLSSWKGANGNSNNGSSWAELREAQSAALALPNTGMAVTIDIGDVNDIHPRNKQDVGKRLAAVALNKTYKKPVAFSGPVFKSIQIRDNQAILSFKYAEGGLWAKDKYGYVKGFEIAGSDQKFYYAKVTIDGDKVVVAHSKVPNPVAVRYGWADDASDGNLYNEAGLPAAPFRTDHWNGITDRVKYSIR
ncbi:sialate O-acetylesterase [Arcticibacter tournemirensis]|uniref:Sialate O-acetylesterase n=1 Tax=Arcticibacter tournemirensis TaxID=699437 RepID=A0A5M9HCW5_9SPHI|nr:sialate O-acetylesterase [Arcticibacter tournemirensis]KAA8484713.1 sialate O-acetylesterase [Arcticibacter tournemirensis]TQM46988.1 sialate O-acetylesterase [Arcticibacter tournemirensis]